MPIRSRPWWIGILLVIGMLITCGVQFFDGDPTTNPNWTELMAAISGLGLMASRDNKITSEGNKVVQAPGSLPK